jgi:hypothetical protein
MALVPAVALGTVAGAVSYTVATGKPKPRKKESAERAEKNTYWRNWVGLDTVEEDAYRAESAEEIQTSYPVEGEDGLMLPPWNDSNVNPAVGAYGNHPGWPRQNFRNMGMMSARRGITKANRAPMPPKQRSMPTV